MTPTQNPDAHSKGHEEQEVHKGSEAFGFFQKHQKLIVMTAGMFVLLTFSIPFALQNIFEDIGGPKATYPVMEVPGMGKVLVDEDDVRAARGIKRVWGDGQAIGLIVFPGLNTGRSDSDVQDRLAALRALAVASGIDASADDVEKVIQRAIEVNRSIGESPFTSAEALAARVQQSPRPDMTLFREQVREALRVSTFLRLTGLGAGSSRSEALVQLLKEHEHFTFEVAAFDGEARREELEKALENDEKTLQDWLAGLDDAKSERFRKPANKAAIKIAALEHAAFNWESFKADLGETQVGDDQVRDHYLANREQRYKVEAPKKGGEEKDGKPGEGNEEKEESEENKAGEGKKDDGNKDNGAADPLAAGRDLPQDPPGGTANTPPAGGQNPEELKSDQTPPDAETQDPTQQDGYRKLDEALQKELRNELYAKALLAKWQVELDQRLAAHMADVVSANMQAALAQEQAEEKLAEATRTLDEDTDPENKEAQQKVVDEAEKAVETAKEAAKQADAAVDARRKTFDIEPVLEELAKGRPGLKFISISEKTDAEGFKKLPGLGTWRDSHLPGQMSDPGEIYMGPVQSTEKGSFIFQVTDIEERPFRAFEDIKEDLTDAYLKEKIKEEAEEKKKAFEEALEKLARAKLADEVKKIEADAKADAEKRFKEWQDGVKQRIADLEAELAKHRPELRIHKVRKQQLEAAKEELGKAEAKRKAIDEEVEKETETKVAEKLATVHKDVMAAAAKEAAIEVQQVGPYSKLLNAEPRFEHRYSGLVRAVFANASPALDLEVGEVTELQSTEEMVWLAVCKAQAPARPDQISRRLWREKFSSSAMSFSGQRMRQAVAQSWSMEALKSAYNWQPAKGVEPGPGAPKDKPGDGSKKSESGDGKKPESGDGEKPGEK